jgi:hypothetical protein
MMIACLGFAKLKMSFIPSSNRHKREDPEVERHYKLQNNAGCGCDGVDLPLTLNCVTIVNKSTRIAQLVTTENCKKC